MQEVNRWMLVAVVSVGALGVPRALAADFNGDGRDDLAIGAPFEDVGASVDAGIVHILYGRNSSGVGTLNNTQWSQNSGGITDICEAGDQFGAALASGDFDNDGFDDLAVGSPEESLGGAAGAGCVHVLYGSASGIRGVGSRQFTQSSGGIHNTPDEDDNFGAALVAGDFDGDGFDDLAIGVSTEDIGSVPDAGAVHILYGSSNGLTGSGAQFWHQNAPGILDVAESGDRFGIAMVAGDFNNDGRDDLAIGAHLEDIGATTNAGGVNVLYGSTTGLRSTGNQFWHQNVAGIADVSEESDLFGENLAAGDFDGDGFDDLAIGVPFENIGSASNCGAVNVIYGSSSRLNTAGDQLWHQNSSGIVDAVESNDVFGDALAVGDFDDDGRDDLAIGVPLEDVGGILGAGAVHVIYGTSAGLRATGADFWNQNSAGIFETAEADLFGTSLSIGDFDNDGFSDLVIGAPNETIFGHPACGAIHIIYGTGIGLTSNGDQLFSQNSSGVVGTGEAGDQFGLAIVQ